MTTEQYTYQLTGSDNRPMLLDVTLDPSVQQQPVIIFIHGFKGFKDWGSFNDYAAYFAAQGFCFVKFNFSHNGTTPEAPLEFGAPEAFAANTFSKEMYDTQQVIDFVLSDDFAWKNNISREVYLIGHSRGGGIALLTAGQDNRISKVVGWASVSRYGNWKESTIERWREEGVMWVENTRTKQRLPMNFSLYEDWHNNADKLDVQHAVQHMHIPVLVVQGTEDEAIPAGSATNIKNYHARLVTQHMIGGANHVFGVKHPWDEGQNWPPHAQELLNVTTEFLKNR